MKIFLDKRKGKKHTIIERMEPLWNSWGHEIQWEPWGADIQLCFIKIESPETNLPIVLRLDGIYYGYDEPKNKPLSRAHQRADGVIYQSHFCKEQIKKFLKPRKSGAIYRIIYNGVVPISYQYLKKPKKDEGINIIATTRWRRWKRLKETLKIFKTAVRHSNLPLKLHVFGTTYDFECPDRQDMKFYGKVSREELWDHYLEGHVFIHLSKNDWCPNSVVEAFSYGLPVLASSAGGGTVELMKLVGDKCGRAGFLVDEGTADCAHDPYGEEWNLMTDIQMWDGAGKLIKLCESDFTPELPEELHIETCAKKYIQIMEEVLGR